MQCPENEDVSYAEGKIKDFRKKNKRIIHSVSTKEGSSVLLLFYLTEI